MPKQAPCSNDIEDGIFTACSAGKQIYSAAVPNARFQAPFQIHTLSFNLSDLIFFPTLTIIPDPSECGIIISKGGLFTPGRPPALAFASEGFTPEKCSFTKTSFAFGLGLSISE